MKLELISMKMCPFCQTALMSLLHHEIEHEVIYLNPQELPDWFEDLTPTGNAPALRVNDDTVLFESAAINEFLDEISTISLLASDNIERALQKAWSGFGADILPVNFELINAPAEETFNEIRETLISRLQKVEAVIKGPFFSGEQLSYTDTFFAPLLLRLSINNKIYPLFDEKDLPKVTAWTNELLQMDCVRYSVVPEFETMYKGMLKNIGGYLGSLITD